MSLPAEWRKKFKKLLILDFEVVIVHVLYCTIFAFLAHCADQENGEEGGALVHLQPILVEQIQNSNEETYFLNQEESKYDDGCDDVM